jgi:alpha-tubulin suppressor-like RCC1 family protein
MFGRNKKTGRSGAIGFVFLLVAMVAVIGLLGSAASASAATSPGQLYAFGLNDWGQLGNTDGALTAAAHPTPEPVALPGQNGSVTATAGGYGQTLIVTSSGQLFSFGENYYGQLGTSTNSGTASVNPVPTPVSMPSGSPPVTEVAAGGYFSLAVTSAGQLYSFGENELGELGRATNDSTTAPNPTPTLVDLPGASGPVTEVVAGTYFSLAVTSTGQLFAFGANDRGQLGSSVNNGVFTPNPTPTLVDLPSGSGAVTEVAAGGEFALVLTSSGQLFGFGANKYGQLASTIGNGITAANPTPESVILPGADGPVTQIAAGQDHSLVLTSTGQLYAFGDNQYGQLGRTANNGSTAANPTPTEVDLPGAIGPVIRVAAGADSSFALTSSGQLYSFGENRFGELGTTVNSGVEEAANPTPARVDFPAGTTIAGVGNGSLADHTLAVVSDLAITITSLPGGTLGTPYGAIAQASGGTAPYRWTADGLPPGLGIDSATGQITGTPTATPGSAVTLSVTDAKGTTASATLPITITVPAPSAPVASAGKPVTSAAGAPRCRVPKLKGRKLKAAKKKLKAADCKLGSVTRLKGATAKSGLVVSQNPRAGKKLTGGSKIAIKLTPHR